MTETEFVPVEPNLIEPGPAVSPEVHAQESSRNPREEMMAKIAARAEEQRNNELALAEVYAADARERAGLDDHTHEEPAASEPAPVRVAAPSDPVADKPTLRTVTLNNGQTFNVTDEQYAQLAHMGAMAAAQQAPVPVHQPVYQPPAPERRPTISAEEAKELARRISYGSDDDGAQAIQQLIERVTVPAQQIDPAALVNEATQRIRSQMTLEQNLARINDEFPEVFGNHTLARLAAIELHDIRTRDAALGVRRDDLDSYREACNTVRNALAPKQSQSEGPKPTAAVQAAPQPDRLERKRAAPRQPTAATRTASMASEAPRFKTGSEIVDQMRRARAQSSMMN